jgi:diguanylate cyclase (GGDEF)-like protein/PAS domain S-box-containing protein
MAVGVKTVERTGEPTTAEQEARFRELFEHGFGLICTHDLQGNIHSINPAAAGALGWRPEELAGCNLTELLAERARPLLPEYLERLRRAGRDEGHMLLCTRTGEERLWAYRNRLMETAGKPPVVLGHAIDVTEQRQAQKALEACEKRYRELFEQSFGVVATLTLEGVVLSLNPAAARDLGYEVEELVGRNLAELMPAPLRPRLSEQVARAVETGSGEGLITLCTRGGEERTLLYRQRCVAEARTPYILINALDVTERLRAEEVLQHQALHDPLTGCANRLFFEDRLAQAVAKAASEDGGQDSPHHVAVVYIGLDDLKAINDCLGHAAGDAVLRETAARLRRLLRRMDTIGRLGGGEFALVLPRAGSRADTERLVQAMVESLAEPFVYRGMSLAIGSNVGVTLFPEHGSTAEELLAGADEAMYRARQEGRNRYSFA